MTGHDVMREADTDWGTEGYGRVGTGGYRVEGNDEAVVDNAENVGWALEHSTTGSSASLRVSRGRPRGYRCLVSSRNVSGRVRLDQELLIRAAKVPS